MALSCRRSLRGVMLLFVFALLAGVASGQQAQSVIVRSTGSRDAMKAAIQSLGGTINQEYQNFNAVAASVPANSMSALMAVPEFKVVKDRVLSLPVPQDGIAKTELIKEVEASENLPLDIDSISQAGQLPSDFAFNNSIIRADALQVAGHLGQGVIVGVIDSGTANNPNVVQALAGTVIGGETFLTPAQDPVRSPTSTHNGLHGTWVGTMVAGHAIFLFSKASCFAQSVHLYSPGSALDGAVVGRPSAFALPMIGVAPAAKIYALKVFPSNSNSTSSSIVLAAVDRALTLKKNFNAGQPSVPVSGTGTENDPFVFNSLNIKVLNMSLGGPTLFPGRNFDDLLTQQVVEAGIVLTTSAGNSGPSGLSTGSPSTGFGSISAAAALTPTHDRITASAFTSPCNLSFGALFHPTNFNQTAFFSSRGPTADGRVGVDVITAGFFNFAQGANGGLFVVSGTSFSAPTVAGAAALLTQAVPSATAKQVRNAIIRGANPALLGDKSTRFDRGHGYLDVEHAFDLLQDLDDVPNTLRTNFEFSGEVEENLEELDLKPRDIDAGETIQRSIEPLRPGERHEFLVQIPKDVASIQFLVTGVNPVLPLAQQNQIFGDDLIFAVHQAKTSSWGDYPVFAFVNSAQSFTVDNPEPGFMRVTFEGDWTNAGDVAASLTISATLKARPDFRREGKVRDGQLIFVPFQVPANLTSATFELTWENDWSHYPTNDLDLILIDPAGKLNFDGATFNGRERAVVKNPKPGNWQLVVVGATVFGRISHGDNDADDRVKKSDKTDEFVVEAFLKK